MKSSILYLGLAVASMLASCSKMTYNKKDLEANQDGVPTASIKEMKKKFIKGAYIVVFKKNIKDVDLETDILTKKHNLKFKYRFKHVLKGFAGQLTPEILEALKNNPKVDYIEQDEVVSVDNSQMNPPSWGLDRLDQRYLPLDGSFQYYNTGAVVDVYIFDTGIRLTHQDFGGRAVMGFDAYGWQGPTTDGHGHGTHVAGTIGGKVYGIAKNVKLIAVRVLGSDGFGAWSDVVAGLDWMTSQHTTNLAVGNMSLSGAGPVRFVEDALKQAVADGITMCVAAGNNGVDAESFTPARVREAITVGATNQEDRFFMNYGPVVDILAPGVNIISAYNTSDNATIGMTGTSMATPHVTGAAALYLSTHPSATPEEVETALKASATANMIRDVPAGTNNLLLNLDFSNPPPLIAPFQVSLNEPGNFHNLASISPVLAWYASVNAASYTVQVSRSAYFTDLIFEASDVTSTFVSGFMLENNTTYYWRVKAINAAGSSVWSTTWNFTTASGSRLGEVPNNNIPYNGATKIAIPTTFAWYSDAGARSYLMQVATDATFNQIVHSDYNVVGNSKIVKGLLPGTLYYWRVSANYVFTMSPWSATTSFRTTTQGN